MRKRKRITLLVTISVPADMKAEQSRKEVKHLITDQSNWRADIGDVKTISVKPAPRHVATK